MSDADRRSVREGERRWLGGALALLAVALSVSLVGCSGTAASASPSPLVTVAPTPTATPTPEPTPVPTPRPTPGPPTESELMDVCDGVPALGAEPYSGVTHPMVVVDNLREPFISGIHRYVGINQKWLDGTLTSGIELVICQDTFKAETDVKVGSCGTYVDDAGHRKTIYRYRKADTVRVVVAATGVTLQQTVIYGKTPTCGMFIVTFNGMLLGDSPTAAQLNAYAVKVSKQAAQ